MEMMIDGDGDDDDDDVCTVFCTVMRRRCMLSSQPGPFSVNDFLASVAKKKKKGKLKLEYSVITLYYRSVVFMCGRRSRRQSYALAV